MQSHQMTDPAAVKTFIMAGNATVTLVSKNTGRRFTYKVNTPKRMDPARPVWFVNLLTGPDNTSNYSMFGYMNNSTPFSYWGRSSIAPTALSVKAWNYAWARIVNGVIPPDLEVWHEGRCCRCGRKLTVPESVASGIGPECAGKMN